MEIILSHRSALEYWRYYGGLKSAITEDRRKQLPISHPNLAHVRSVVPSELSYPINLSISSQTAIRNTKTIQSRLFSGQTQKGCFISVDDGLVVSSPAFCFFQMANDLPLVKLIQLGYELCGTYSLRDIGEYSPGVEATDKTLYGRPQLTGIKKIKALTARLKGVNGQKKADRALRYITDGSASPMETIITMLLTLPYQLGGYGLPLPELNKAIYTGHAGKRKSGKPDFKCDLFWSKANLAIEYDSDFYHTGADRIASDANRRFSLIELGITPISVTSRQVLNRGEFENRAKLVARKLGKRLRYNEVTFLKANRELRGLLL